MTARARYLLISVSSGTQPSNRVWYVDLQEIPLDSMDALDFSGDKHHVTTGRNVPSVHGSSVQYQLA